MAPATIATIIVIIGAGWVLLGQAGSPSGQTGTSGQANCDACNRDIAWYQGLSPAQKALKAAWYALRVFNCRRAGC